MEVVKSGLCKEEIEYAQRCRVYIKTDEPRPVQRISKRPHIGRYKLISTAKSTEHISFARRLKRLRESRKIKSSSESQSDNKEALKSCYVKLQADSLVEDSTSQKSNRLNEKKNCIKSAVGPKTGDSKRSDKSISKEKDSIKTKLKAKSGDQKSLKEKKGSSKAKVEKKSVAQETDSEGSSEYCNIELLEEGSKSSIPTKEDNSSRKNARKNIKKSKKDQVKNNMNYPHFQSSFEAYIKPILSKNNSFKKTLNPTLNQDNGSSINLNSDPIPRSQLTSTPKPTKNGGKTYSRIPDQVRSKIADDSKVADQPINTNITDCETYYWLEVSKPKQSEPRKLAYVFDNLVNEVKHMKLPNSEWKIKIMVHKQEMISMSFAKKKNQEQTVPDKLVTINAKTLVCDITIGNKKVSLLGSPVYMHSVKDLEILLDIVNGAEIDSPIVSIVKATL